MKKLMEAVTLKNAAKGSKSTMWTDPERYPKIADASMVKTFTCDHVKS